MNISPVSSSTTATTSLSTSYETQIQQLEARAETHKDQIAKIGKKDDESSLQSERIRLLEAQIQLIEIQIDKIKAQERLQEAKNDKNNSSNNSKDKDQEDLLNPTNSIKNVLRNDLDVTV